MPGNFPQFTQTCC